MSEIISIAQSLKRKIIEYKLFTFSSVPVNISQEVVPYKNWDDIVSFLELVESGCLPEWMDDVDTLQTTTSYCYKYSDILNYTTSLVKRSTPKTLLCHDYKGGYLEDRFVNYNWKELPNLYGFSQWHLLDTFNYFSHYLITVPPPCWINAGHAHGVAVLGTLITEGDSGQEFWDDVLQSELHWRVFADCLILINNVHKFDGYLINVENKLTVDQVQRLLAFLHYLKQNLPKNSQIIWYDSVTINGSLHWQNSLNYLNEPFFNVCHGIYLNYNYRKWELEQTAHRAGDRQIDVYVGIDVFGRGSFGSGFCCADGASMARDNNLSIAIFAPGWTREAAPGLPLLNDRIFWSSLSPYLYVHGTISPLTKYLLGGNITPDSNCNYLIKKTSPMFLWNGTESQIVLALLPPMISKKDRRTLVNMQEQVVTFNSKNIEKYYKDLPTPVLDKIMANTLWINTDGEKEAVKIPLILLEMPVIGDLNVMIEACSVGGPKTKNGELFVYILIKENDVSAPVRHKSKVQLDTVDWKTTKLNWFAKGLLLEVGLVAEPFCKVNVQMLRISNSLKLKE